MTRAEDRYTAGEPRSTEKAENTLGLFVAIEGFQDAAVSKHSGRGSPLLLMDGGDLLAVLEQRTAFQISSAPNSVTLR